MNEQMPEAIRQEAERAEEAVKKAKSEATDVRTDEESMKQSEEPPTTVD